MLSLLFPCLRRVSQWRKTRISPSLQFYILFLFLARSKKVVFRFQGKSENQFLRRDFLHPASSSLTASLSCVLFSFFLFRAKTAERVSWPCSVGRAPGWNLFMKGFVKQMKATAQLLREYRWWDRSERLQQKENQVSFYVTIKFAHRLL